MLDRYRGNPLRTEGPQRPLVTCLCLTSDRRDWLPTAIDCFLKQTYRPLEMIIVNDRDADPIQDLVPWGKIESSATISLWNGLIIDGQHVDRPRTLGDKRNAGCQLAHGELITHWDDDDWSAPTRVEVQVAAMNDNPDAVMGGFRNMVFVDETGSCHVYKGYPGFIIGTSLIYKKTFWEKHPFESRNVCEDSRFIDQVPIQQRATIDGVTELMFATVHERNTSPRTINTYSWAKIERPSWVIDHPGFELERAHR